MMAKIRWLMAIGDDDGYPPKGEGPSRDAVYSPTTLATDVPQQIFRLQSVWGAPGQRVLSVHMQGHPVWQVVQLPDCLKRLWNIVLSQRRFV